MAHVNGDRTKQKIGQFADGQQLERNPQKSIHEKQMNVITITGMNCCWSPLESRLDSYPAEVPEIRNINFVIAVRQTVFRIATAGIRQKKSTTPVTNKKEFFVLVFGRATNTAVQIAKNSK